jgi:RNA-binding protein
VSSDTGARSDAGFGARPAARTGTRYDADERTPKPKRGKVIRTAKKNAKSAALRKAKKPVPMTPRRIQFLKGVGHKLEPVLSVGKEGITAALIKACLEQIRAHELIKVKVQQEAPEDRHETASALASAASATLVQVLGRTFLLYKRHPDKPRIELP